MKISIVVPIFRRIEEIDIFFERMLGQDLQNFELIAIVDTNVNKQLDQIVYWIKKFGSRGKIIFNTKRRGYSKSVAVGLTAASSEYVWSITTSDKVSKISGISELIESMKKANDPDIFEFPLQFSGIIKWNPPLRIHSPKAKLISSKPMYIAKTMPVLFNKIFKRDIVISALRMKPYREMNSRFIFEILYVFLMKEDITFATSKKTVTRTNISKKSFFFNPTRLMTQWKSVFAMSELQDGKYQSELFYASLFHQMVLIGKFTTAYKMKVMQQKYWKAILVFRENHQNSLIHNRYVLENSTESILISKIRTQADLKKVLKEF